MHALGWAFALVLAFVQPWGLTAADTKLDLLVDPAGFLAQATEPYTDIFTLGQLQNQAYGYLFPQGLFFLLTDFLPDWVAQRLWWTLVLGVGFSGVFELLKRLNVGSPAWNAVAAALFMLSPRALSTLSTISSETWPVMLAPWVIVPLINRPNWAASALVVGAMGAVNATATAAACVPAFVYILARRRSVLPQWLAGVALISVWWLLPLFALGKYSPPFTDFIESSFVTTRWLNLTEVLRGTTSWAPFVETERVAGTLLATDPTFVLLTVAVAAVGLAGLAMRRDVFTAMLLVGVLVMSPVWAEFLDGPGAALRNVHKFDPLVRIPLVVGFAHVAPKLVRSAPVVALVAVLAMSPAWSARLLPVGAFEKIPDDWRAATDFVNKHAQNTRTLIVPKAAFARQDWGWTRDEPAQPLLDVPWAVRDAIPLVPPEAIRGLDGKESLTRLGIGAVIVRNDLEDRPFVDPKKFGDNVHTFGDISVVLIHNDPYVVAPNTPTKVAGGGEVLGLLDQINGPHARDLTDNNATIVTDTPVLTDRNYGAVDGARSAPLADRDEGTVKNRVPDYPSAGPLTKVTEIGGTVTASSSESDASSFGGANPARSLTAAVDGHPNTAWWPARGDSENWLELRGEFAKPKLKIKATDPVQATIRNGQASTDVDLGAGETTTVSVPGGRAEAIRIELSHRVGISEVSVVGHRLERIVTVPDTSPDVQQFVFDALEGPVIRQFTSPRDMDVELASSGKVVIVDGVAYEPGSKLTLKKGTHRVRSDADWVSLTVPGFAERASYERTDSRIEPADSERLLVTGRATNPGLRGELNGVPLEPRVVDAATQAFVIPPGKSGDFTMYFAGKNYLSFGFAVSIVTAIFLAFRRRPAESCTTSPGWVLPVFGGLVIAVVGGLPGLIAGVTAWAVVRWTTIPAPALSAVTFGLAGVFLSRAPWPSADYAGDSVLTAALCCAAIAALVVPRGQSLRQRPES